MSGLGVGIPSYEVADVAGKTLPLSTSAIIGTVIKLCFAM